MILVNIKFKSLCQEKINSQFLLFIFLLFLFTFNIVAQSSDQNLPTPLGTNQINGEIKARDIGDSRLTTFYYIFNGNRGDIFVNVVATNLNGDIDIFEAEGIKPKTKITLYADNSENETGRVIYLRKPEKLILRIQGRTPNDDPATFQIKFAGSFEPIQGISLNSVPERPTVSASNDAKVKVNSVGTIIEKTPETTPTINEVKVEDKDDVDERVAVIGDENETKREILKAEDSNKSADNKDARVTENISAAAADAQKVNLPKIPSTFDPTKKVDDIIREKRKVDLPKLILTDNLNKDDSDLPNDSEVIVDMNDKKKNTSAIIRIERATDEVEVENNDEIANPLAKILLKVELKNGDKFERSMAEVLSMNVIKGILTIVTNDGKIQEYSILDVVKMTIE